jgi:hypothetical protein
MSSPVPEKILELEERVTNFLPESEERRPTVFLTLAPAMSSTFPQSPKPSVPGNAEQPKPTARRTSSMSSDGKPTFRILKLGPVHYGDHAGDHKEDWHDVVIE